MKIPEVDNEKWECGYKMCTECFVLYPPANRKSICNRCYYLKNREILIKNAGRWNKAHPKEASESVRKCLLKKKLVSHQNYVV